MVAIVTHPGLKLCLQHCAAVVFPFHVWFSVLAAFLQPRTPAGLQACTPINKKKCWILKQPNMLCPLGMAAFLLLWQHYCFQTLHLWWDQITAPQPGASDKKQSANFTGKRWVARQRSSAAISPQSSRICVRIAHADVINGAASEKATSVINQSELLTRWLLSPFVFEKAVGFLMRRGIWREHPFTMIK